MSKESVHQKNDESFLESFVEDADTIVPEEREKIFNEIERVVAENAREVTPDQFMVHASHKGFKFPLIVNAILVMLLILVVSVVTVYAKKQQQQFLYSTQEISTEAGSALVSSIIEESQAKVTAREEALQAIQKQLDDLISGQQNIDATYVERIDQFKEEQENNINNQLQILQATLESKKVETSGIQEQLEAQRAVLMNEYESKLREYIEQQNQERLAREKAVATQIDKLQSRQAQRQSEIDSLQDEITRRKEELAAQQGKTNEELASVRAQLASLAQDKEERKRALDELAIYYNNVTSAIVREDYANAQDGIADARNAILASPYKADEEVQLYLSLYSFYEQLIEKILVVQGKMISEIATQELLDTQNSQVSALQEEIESKQEEIGTLRTDYENEQQRSTNLQNKYDTVRNKNSVLQNDLNLLKKEFNKNIQAIITYLRLKNWGTVDPTAKEHIDKLLNSPLAEQYESIANSLVQVIDPSGLLEFP